jgi:zinc transporter ZupT
MGLVVAGVLSTVWMRPVMGLTFDVLEAVLSPLGAWVK